jgi:adenosine deaminase CECR1
MPELLFPHARSEEMQDTMFIRSTLALTMPKDFEETEIVFNVFPKGSPAVNIFSKTYNPNVKDPENFPWMLWRDFRRDFPSGNVPTKPKELNAAERWARAKMIVTEDHAYGQTATHNSSWACFNQGTRAFKGLVGYEGVYRWYIGRVIESMIDDKVMYAELRPMLLDKTIPSNDGLRKLGHRDQMAIICEEVAKKKKELQDQQKLDKFPFGLKIIYCTPRSIPLPKMKSELDDCIQLKLAFPELICGFDLVGAEDRPNCVGYYADLLLAFQETCQELKISIPFMFHAGETLIDTGGSSDPKNSNLYDSLLLNAKRIGHGYALLKHPLLVEKYKEQNICLELCPISNELLHLCGNAREHPYPQLLAAGLHCTLNADNPSLFR